MAKNSAKYRASLLAHSHLLQQIDDVAEVLKFVGDCVDLFLLSHEEFL